MTDTASEPTIRLTGPELHSLAPWTFGHIFSCRVTITLSISSFSERLVLCSFLLPLISQMDHGCQIMWTPPRSSLHPLMFSHIRLLLGFLWYELRRTNEKANP